jgi:hypothetical protein
MGGQSHGETLEFDDAHLAGLLETYDVAIAGLEDLDDPAVETLLASLRMLRQRAERQADEVSAHLLALS